MLATRELNRSTLARRLLLEREALDAAEAVRRVVACRRDMRLRRTWPYGIGSPRSTRPTWTRPSLTARSLRPRSCGSRCTPFTPATTLTSMNGALLGVVQVAAQRVQTPALVRLAGDLPSRL
ncbi:hypothetical protein GCM10010140_05050 [Streptosporangium pseudovulgare]|uniref:Uncharacterized protein n=1 Tax=Streptosporangium pseudovulgare TaxID=35765 RepID=A0ABQ2QHH4_9ACTN|nr:hypothetical protein [Streptosporangium pseudovulgare]GGP79534.1 hypothetical protein GCM10010140_05050 [Streptosporangium pseudovulgare]